MKHLVMMAMTTSIALTAAPVEAAVVMDARQAPHIVMDLDANPAGAAAIAAPSADDPVTVIEETLSTYATMIPIPPDWVLMVAGFGIIGFALRSRKRARINFN